MKIVRTLERFFPPWIMSYVSLVIGWWILSLFFPHYIVPSPPIIFGTLKDIILYGNPLRHVAPTMMRIALGFGASMALGISMGVLMGARKYWESFFRDYVTVSLSIPALCWAALATMWFGLKPTAPLVATTLITFPYVALNIWEGVRGVDKELVDMARSFEVPSRTILRKIIFPSLMPFLFAATRYGFAISWKIVAIAEMFAASAGMGYMIVYSYETFSMRGVIAWTLLFTAIILFIEYAFFKPAEKYVLRWRPEMKL